jgi:hypothetical protein
MAAQEFVACQYEEEVEEAMVLEVCTSGRAHVQSSCHCIVM